MQPPAHTALHWLERVLFLAGAMALAAVFVVRREAVFLHVRVQGELHQLASVSVLPGDGSQHAAVTSADEGASVLGYLSVPSLGLSVPVLEGVDGRTLNLAAGHIPQTPLPGDDGNAALAGHRDTVFRALKDIRAGDTLSFVSGRGVYQYRVRRVIVVEPDDVWVLQPWDRVHLTLITCYPFTFIGASPQRHIVQAERIGAATPRS